jgi:hypothetical protein
LRKEAGKDEAAETQNYPAENANKRALQEGSSIEANGAHSEPEGEPKNEQQAGDAPLARQGKAPEGGATLRNPVSDEHSARYLCSRLTDGRSAAGLATMAHPKCPHFIAKPYQE